MPRKVYQPAPYHKRRFFEPLVPCIYEPLRYERKIFFERLVFEYIGEPDADEAQNNDYQNKNDDGLDNTLLVFYAPHELTIDYKLSTIN